MSQIIHFINLNFGPHQYSHQIELSKTQTRSFTGFSYLSAYLLPSGLNPRFLACHVWQILLAMCSSKLISSSPGHTAGVHCLAILAVSCDHVSGFLANRTWKKMTRAIPNLVHKNLPCHPPCSLFPSWLLGAESPLQGSGALGNSRAIRWKKSGLLE